MAKMERRKVRAAVSSFLHRQVFITQGHGHDFYNVPELRELASGFKSTPRLPLRNVFSLRKEKVVLPAKQREQGDAII